MVAVRDSPASLQATDPDVTRWTTNLISGAEAANRPGLTRPSPVRTSSKRLHAWLGGRGFRGGGLTPPAPLDFWSELWLGTDQRVDVPESLVAVLKQLLGRLGEQR